MIKYDNMEEYTYSKECKIISVVLYNDKWEIVHQWEARFKLTCGTVYR